MLSNPQKWFHELKEPFKGSKTLFREPNKVPMVSIEPLKVHIENL